jgi:hypothetical protein
MHGSLVELLPPGDIDHLLPAHLTGGQVNDLIVIRGNLLEVWKVNEQSTFSLYSRHSIAAKVLDLARIPSSAGDKLLLAFANGQHSIVQYRKMLLELVTVSLHHYAHTGGLIERLPSALGEHRLIAVEGEGRCSIMRTGDSFTILPLSGDESHNWQSSVVPFTDIDKRLRNVIDFCTLPGYLETTLAILYEPMQTWPLRYPARKDTVALIIITIDLKAGEHPTFTVLASHDDISSDVRKIWTLRQGGLFLVGANVLLHVDPGHPLIAGTALNPYASLTTKMPIRKTGVVLKTTFSDAHFIEGIEGGKINIVADDGEWYTCQVHRDGSGRRIELQPSNPIIPELKGPISLLTRCNDLLLAKSVIGDVLVIDGLFTGPVTVVKNSPSAMDLEDDLYNESSTLTTNLASPHIGGGSSNVVQRIICLGPISDFCIGGDPERGSLEIATASGNAHKGAVTIFKRNLPLIGAGIFNLNGAKAIHPVGGYYIVSYESSSAIFRKRGDSIETVKDSAIVDDEATILLATLPSGMVVQVTPSKWRIMTLDLNMVVSELPMTSFSRAINGAAQGSFIIIGHEDGSLTGYNFEKESPTPILFDPRFSNNVMAWDLCQQGESMLLGCVVGGALWIGVLGQDMQTVFYNDTLAALPVLMSRTDDERAGSLDIVECDISDMAFIVERSCFLLVVASASAGLLIYRQVEGSLLRIPMSHYTQGLSADTFQLSLSKVILNGQSAIMATTKSKSSWIILIGQSGYPRVHSLRLSNSIVHVSKDMFIYTENGSLTRYAPDGRFSLDYDWPFMRIELEEAVRSIVYHAPSTTYSLLVTKPVTFILPKDDYAPISDNVDFVIPPEGMPPTSRNYALKLLSTHCWQIIDEHALDIDEYGLCMVSATLETKQTASGRQPFLVVGTSINRGEDRPARGRVLVLDVIKVVPEVDRPETDRRYKLLASPEMKGPVTAACHVAGHLVVSIGAKLIVHSFENNETLTGVAFVDVGVYASTLVSVKNFFIVGDAVKSLSFHAFQERPPKVVTLARDFEERAILAVEFMVDGEGGGTTIVSADAAGNVHLLAYLPTNRDSDGGMRLSTCGSLRLSDPIRRMRRVNLSTGHACLLATKNGSIIGLMPISESTFRRLAPLQLRLAASLPHVAGMHPRAARQAAPLIHRPLPLTRMLIDSTAVGLLRIIDLPLPARRHLLAALAESNQPLNAILCAACHPLQALWS